MRERIRSVWVGRAGSLASARICIWDLYMDGERGPIWPLMEEQSTYTTFVHGN